jgi:hypothetical protein
MDEYPSLDQWVALTPDERNRLRREWSGYDEYFLNQDWMREEGYWVHLLHEATERFKAEYGAHPLVNHVSHSAGLTAGMPYEPGILVTTALSTLQRVEELPDRYLTFAVYQEPIADTRRYYVRTWELVLGHFLGWTEQRVRDWAREEWGDELDGKNGGLFYHWSETHYVARLLIPAGAADELDAMARLRLGDAIEHALGRPLSEHPYDWAAARERVRQAIDDALAAERDDDRC